MNQPIKEIRATYKDNTIRIYQAYSDAIADSTLAHGKFMSPPFKTERMTWIKPSFLWMMYRAGWGKKDDNQKRILALDISIEGFDWALEHSLMSNHFSQYTKEEWIKLKETTPVRIQWDPERDLFFKPLTYRSIQIGLSNEAVPLYVNEWIKNITEVTNLASQIHSLIQKNKIKEAKLLLPKEIPYIPSEKIQKKVEISM
ncbi:MAG: Unknown protein [uncultured Sulfurovum sp.]|uniref:DUF4291 domain-containing protein n=1 Tax=uncultured Sulfurovum sp. TaxID=269237 RepID=A0A6S6T3Q2_9BACT|nr:MAG: Unknown protein [uncultured Sulfurovum sp.]